KRHRPPLRSTLFPYTTLFRSHPPSREPERAPRPAPALAAQSTLPDRADPWRARRDRARHVRRLQTRPIGAMSGFLIIVIVFGARSEEHTSELQSRSDLVCRLL